MQSMSLATDSLDSAVKRVRDEIMEPYVAIRLKTLQLKNLQVGSCCHHRLVEYQEQGGGVHIKQAYSPKENQYGDEWATVGR